MSTEDHLPEKNFTNTLTLTYSLFKKAVESVDHFIILAGIKIHLKFIGPHLLNYFLPALSHLENGPLKGNADYTFYIWDAGYTGQQLPLSPVKITNSSYHGEVDGLNDSNYQTAYFKSARMLNLVSHKDRIGLICLSDINCINDFEISSPFRSIFSWILPKANKAMIHAAAVGTEQGAILIGGMSGAGKSSTSLQCLMAGLLFLGDDICAISIENETPTVHSLYSTAKTHKADVKNFLQIKNTIQLSEKQPEPKAIYFLGEYLSAQTAIDKQIKAVVIPDHKTDLFGLAPISPAIALNIMGTGSKNMFPGGGNEVHFILSAVLKKVPCYKLNLGKIRENIPKLIEELANI